MSTSTPTQATGKSSLSVGRFAWHRRRKRLKAYQKWWKRGVTVFPILGNLCQMLPSRGLYWQEKREQEVNLFFCFGNWVWHVWLSKYDPFKHFRGKSVVPASISVMWQPMFGPPPLLYDEKTTQISQTLTYWRWVDASFLCKLRVPVQDLAACWYIFLWELWVWNGLRLTVTTE